MTDEKSMRKPKIYILTKNMPEPSFLECEGNKRGYWTSEPD